MPELPRIKRDPALTAHLCKCRPVCKNRRRIWRGEIQKTSAELLLENKLLPPCFRRWPSKMYPNAPCPLLKRVKGITVRELNSVSPHAVVRVCMAPLDDTVDTTYLQYTQLAREIGAWQAVRQSHCFHPFCECGKCCPCSKQGYQLSDDERETRRRADMHRFDARVKIDNQKMRIMYL